MQSLSDLVITISETTVVLDAHVEQAVLVQRTQVETADSVLRLGQTMSDLVNVAHEEMDRINTTGAALRDEWMKAGRYETGYLDWRHWSDWTRYGTIWLLQVICKGEGNARFLHLRLYVPLNTFADLVDDENLERVMGSKLITVLGYLCRLGVFILHSGLTFITVCPLSLLIF